MMGINGVWILQKGLNPLTRELNVSRSGCLPEFFLGVLNFNVCSYKKKSYLIDFSFKFNEIKFGNLLMNWFIPEKMFAYCYNKFRPMNRMHYIKCSVNSLLLNSGCCRRSVAPWITILSQHTLYTILSGLQINLCVIFCETRHHAQVHVTLCALVRHLSVAT